MSSSYTGTSLWLPVHHPRCRVCSPPHPDYLQDYPHRQEFMSFEPRVWPIPVLVGGGLAHIRAHQVCQEAHRVGSGEERVEGLCAPPEVSSMPARALSCWL